MNNTKFKNKVSQFIGSKTPFVFVIDFEMQNPLVYTLDELEGEGFLYNIKGATNAARDILVSSDIHLKVNPLAQDTYLNAFNEVQLNINKGNSFLLNLTFPSEISTNASLEIFFILQELRTNF